MVFKNIKVRLYPTVKQQKILNLHFDGYRFAYNLCLDYKSKMYKWYGINKSGYDMQNELFDIRKETPWLNQCKAECIRYAALSVEKTFKNLYNGSGYPKFKSKKGEQSFFAQQNILCTGNSIKFFGFKITFSTSINYTRLLNTSKIKNASFNRDHVGDYWVTCLIEVENTHIQNLSNKVIGIDLGIKSLIVTSDGVNYENNKFLRRTHFKIAKLQRKFSRTQNGSNNRNKLRIKIAKCHRKVVRQKEHYYHFITNDLTHNNQTIVIESLMVKNMIKNHSLARSIADASWGLLIKMLEYKCIIKGCKIIKIDRFYPSSKTCSNCGRIKDMPLSERIYNCECGLSIDRDFNAAINIKNSGLKIPVVPVEGKVTNPLKQEVKVKI